MKLILCKTCQDVVKLDYAPRSCKCGDSGGVYLDDGNFARYWGDKAVPIGFGNNTLAEAVRNQPAEGMGERFSAWIIPASCYTMEKVVKPKELL